MAQQRVDGQRQTEFTLKKKRKEENNGEEQMLHLYRTMSLHFSPLRNVLFLVPL